MNNLTESDILSLLPKEEAEKTMTKIKKAFVNEKLGNKHIKYVPSENKWRVVFSEGGKKKQIKKTSIEDMYDYLYEYFSDDKDNKADTVKEVFDEAENYRQNVRNRSANTIKRDKQAYERFIDDKLSQMPINNVNAEYLNKYVNDKNKKGHYKERALDMFKSILNIIFSYAYEKGVINSNPVDYINLQDYYKDCDLSVKSADERIFTPKEIEDIEKIIRESMRSEYDPQAYAILLSIKIGCRVGELPPLRWSDITNDGLHIYRQQIHNRTTNEFTIVGYTKNERLHPHGGRYFPITNDIAELLHEIKTAQENTDNDNEYIFVENNGVPITKQSISKRLLRVMHKHGYRITQNHAFRRSLNSNVLIPMGLSPNERSYLLGHSIEVNERNYTYYRKEALDSIRIRFNTENTPSYTKTVNFLKKKEALKSARTKASN